MDSKVASPLGNWMLHKILPLDVILTRPTSRVLNSHHDAIGNILLRDFVLSLLCHWRCTSSSLWPRVAGRLLIIDV